MTEEWRQSPDFPNYFVSAEGQVRHTTVFKNGRVQELILKPYTYFGSQFYYLYNNGVRKKISITRLIASVYVETPYDKEGMEVQRKDPEKGIHYTNLRYAPVRLNKLRNERAKIQTLRRHYRRKYG
jgi:hypothetical protein